jgi:hypothetical protein
MRLPLIIIFFIFVQCYAQDKKESVVPHKTDTLAVPKVNTEKTDTSVLRIRSFFQNHHILFTMNNLPYFNAIPKVSLSHEFAEMVKTPRQLAEENLKNIMAEVREETADKRGWFLRFLEDFLGVAKKVVVVALAVAVLLK